ncbi:AAA family ATPase [Salmonella enterica]|nr:AAA family ATPase [Salmonella enterica]
MKKAPFYIISFRKGDVILPLHNLQDKIDKAKITVVIGPNGSGKSTVLASLVDELDLISDLLKSVPYLPRQARDTAQTEIVYRLGDDIFTLIRKGADLSALMNEKKVSPQTIPFPEGAVAVAYLPTDKFRFSDNDGNPFYRYLGLRQATNMVTTGSLETKVISSLLKGLRSENYCNALNEWTSILNISGFFELEFRAMSIDVFSVKNVADLEKVARRTQFRKTEEIILHILKGKDNSLNDKLLEEFFEKLYFICGKPQLNNVNNKKSRKRATYTLKISDLIDQANVLGISWEQGVEIIRKLRLADEIRLIVNKDGKATAFADLSSGERSVFGTVARLFEFVGDKNLIVIDEPEVSLHPSWQIRYIPTLMKALNHLKSVHVVIATHSHFMVSDVENASSLIVAGTDGSGAKTYSNFEGDVYGRTPDNILYRVFGVGAVTNFYVEKDLSDALYILSAPERMNIPKLTKIRARLQKVVAEDNSAFNEIISIIDKKLGENVNAENK